MIIDGMEIADKWLGTYNCFYKEFTYDWWQNFPLVMEFEEEIEIVRRLKILRATDAREIENRNKEKKALGRPTPENREYFDWLKERIAELNKRLIALNLWIERCTNEKIMVHAKARQENKDVPKWDETWPLEVYWVACWIAGKVETWQDELRGWINEDGINRRMTDAEKQNLIDNPTQIEW